MGAVPKTGQRRMAKDGLVLTGIVVVTAVVVLALLSVPITHRYSATVETYHVAQLELPSQTPVTVSWFSFVDIPGCGMLNGCGVAQVTISQGEDIVRSPAINPPNSGYSGSFSFTTNSGSYYIWAIGDLVSGINYTVTYSVPLI
jgi:hypothetical protein